MSKSNRSRVTLAFLILAAFWVQWRAPSRDNKEVHLMYLFARGMVAAGSGEFRVKQDWRSAAEFVDKARAAGVDGYMNTTLAGLPILLLITAGAAFWMGRGASRKEEFLRGARLVTARQLARQTSRQPCAMRLGGVPIPVAVELLHLALIGGTGSGKSVAIIEWLDHLRHRGRRAVIVDLGGQFLARFYQPGDTIINHLDARSAAIDPVAEVRSIADCDAVAASICPTGFGQAREWSGYAQTMLSACMSRLHQVGKGTTQELVRMATIASTHELGELCHGTPAGRFFEEGNERMLSSILSIAADALKPFSHLRPVQEGERFSLRDFIEQEGSGWLFLTVRDDQLATMKGLISAQLDIMITTLLSLPPDSNRRIFFCLDEFASLGRIASVDGLLTRARKAGGVALLGLQSISQLRETYGRDQAQTLLSCLSSQLILRCADADTADAMSRTLGKTEMLERRQGESYQQGLGKSSRSWSEQKNERAIVLPAELQNLPDRTGYLSLAGDLPTAKISFPAPVNHGAGVPAFIPAAPAAPLGLGGSAR